MRSTHRFGHVGSRLTALASTAANWGTLESRSRARNLSLSSKHPPASSSSSRVTHWTTWLRSRVGGQKWREPRARHRGFRWTACVLSVVAVLALIPLPPPPLPSFPPPPPAISPSSSLGSTSARLRPASSRRFDNRPELATILSTASHSPPVPNP